MIATAPDGRISSVAGVTAWVLGDQLSHESPALVGADRVLMVESRAKLGAGRWHRQKLHLLLSAMRHFAAELRERGMEVDYRRSPDLARGLRAHMRASTPDTVRLLRPTSTRGLEAPRRAGRRRDRGPDALPHPPRRLRGVGRL